MTRKVCVDASLALKWVVQEEDSELAEDLLRQWQRRRVQLLAPALFLFEGQATLRKLVYRKILTEQEGQEAWDHFSAVCGRLTFLTPTDLLATAWEMARTYQRPTTYDAAYLALALLQGCELWTADRRLVKALNGRLPWVQFVGKA